jgi:AcrR family transcriptional regulator
MTVMVTGAGAEVGSADAFTTRTFTPTEERILIAALGLIGRQGVQRLGMAQIADAAGVARGTLYRYFPSREHVLAAAADYDEVRFRSGLDEALANVWAPEERIGAFVGYAFDFIRSHPARPLFESEPGFVLSYLLDHLPALRGELIGRLGDALDTVPAVRDGYLDRDRLADVIVRLFGSSWIIPETDEASLVDSLRGILQI